MGERKGQNHYYPPDFDPKKHGNLNAYHGTHALRERARKLDRGILIIRFEMPYNIWCDGCKAHIAMGVRYNAEKKKVGKYLSTPIHEFRMKCHLCDQHFEIRTDPKNMDYVIMSGAKRKEQRWDMGENGQIVTEERADLKRLAVDAMFAAEHEMQDKEKVGKLMPTLRELEEVKSEWKDDYKLNVMMRNVLRSEKKALSEQKAKDQKFLDKWNLDINLVRENEEDIKIASLYKFNTISSDNESDKTRKRKTLETESIFDDASKPSKKQKLQDKEVGEGEKKVSTKSRSISLTKKFVPKQSSMSFLKNKLSKSFQEKKLESTGFSLSTKSSSSEKGKEEETTTSLNKSSFVLVKKNNVNSPTTSKLAEKSASSSCAVVATTSNNSSNCGSAVNVCGGGLVSNDYGSDDTNSDSN